MSESTSAAVGTAHQVSPAKETGGGAGAGAMSGGVGALPGAPGTIHGMSLGGQAAGAGALLSHWAEGAAPVQASTGPGGVKIGKPAVSTDRESASLKGREIAQLIKAGKWKPDDNQQLAHWLEFFEGPALSAFMFELKDALGAKDFEGKSKKLTDAEGESANGDLIIPTSEAKVSRGGFKVAYFAQMFEETSESNIKSTSVEVYTDTSASAGLSVEIPVFKVAKFKFGADVKKGRKTTEKEEEKKEDKKANRNGTTISRSFTIQKLVRDVMDYRYVRTRFGPGPISHHVTEEGRGWSPESQQGYQIVPDEGGKPWGPFWPDYADSAPVEGSALSPVWEVLKEEQKHIAEDLVFGR